MASNAKVGYIYILTNESFHQENCVKIGYTSNIEKRVNDLSNTSVPKPFKVYAMYEIPYSPEMEKSDKMIHNLIDQLSPGTRINDKREFFTMYPEEAYQILYAIAKIHGRTNS